MKYCNKCEKQTPTTTVGKREECMVCGSEIIQETNHKSYVNASTMKSLRELTKTNKDTGKYTNAQNVGRNVLIGLLIILVGILFSVGGLELVLKSVVFGTIALVLIAILLWFIAMVS